MAKFRFTAAERQLVKDLVTTYEKNKHLVSSFRNQLRDAITESPDLALHIHSVKTRIKDNDRLRDKIFRKIECAKQDGKDFDITPDNLLIRINDLVGVRILHLHTRQILDINRQLTGILEEQRYELLEGPFARTWDDESRTFLKSCSIETQESPSLYTSIHYVVGSASRTTVTGEIQVRTLMEEVWGEVDHSINYPHPVGNLSCREQLKVLARVTSSATRLVDSIFLTFEDYKAHQAADGSQDARAKPGKKARILRGRKKSPAAKSTK